MDEHVRGLDDSLDTPAPVHMQPMKDLIKALPKRFVGLFNKLISFKFFTLAMATFLILSSPEVFPWYAWIIVYLITMFGREGLKFLKEVKK